MANSWFQFKQFSISQDRCAMKVTTDASLFGAWTADAIRQSGAAGPLLDIGAGTGLLSLMIAQQNPLLSIDAVEIDAGSAMQAMENCAAAPWSERIHVWQADVKTIPAQQQYGLIVSNPPFYENEWRSSSDKKNVAHHSEELTLEELLQLTGNCLAEKGRFCFLFPYKRKKDLEEAVRKKNLFIHRMMLVRQSVKHDYFRIMIAGGLEPVKEVLIDEMAIWDAQQQYTPAFINLLKEYYLYL